MKTLKYNLLLVALVALVSCSEKISTDPFPDERLTPDEHVAAINELLVSAEYGWSMILKPNVEGIGGFKTFVKFNEDNTSEMIADFRYEETSSTTIADAVYFDASKTWSNIHYEVKKVSNFELSFQTYCFIHRLIDLGQATDFQFRIGDYNEDYILLYDGDVEMKMERAEASDWERSSINEYFSSQTVLEQYSNNTVLFSFLEDTENNRTQIVTDRSNRAITFYYYDEDSTLIETKQGYSYTKDGILMREELTIPGLGSFQELTFDGFETNDSNGSKTLKLMLDGDKEAHFISSVNTLVPVDDGIYHFMKVRYSNQYGGSFWAARKKYEQGFRYSDGYTFFGGEDSEYFSEFSIYLDYFNDAIPATYNTFTFVFDYPSTTEYYNVYFTYETSGTDQIIFKLDEDKGRGGYSSYIDETYVKPYLEGMVNKMIQPEGFTLVSTEYENFDGSLRLYIVDNKSEGFMTMITGTVGVH